MNDNNSNLFLKCSHTLFSVAKILAMLLLHNNRANKSWCVWGFFLCSLSSYRSVVGHRPCSALKRMLQKKKKTFANRQKPYNLSALHYGSVSLFVILFCFLFWSNCLWHAWLRVRAYAVCMSGSGYWVKQSYHTHYSQLNELIGFYLLQLHDRRMYDGNVRII